MPLDSVLRISLTAKPVNHFCLEMASIRWRGLSSMRKTVSGEGLDIHFRKARSHNGWEPKPVSDIHIKAIYELLKWAPTSANCAPARFVFVQSRAAKEKLRPCLMEDNIDKTMAAPLTVIIGHDLEFHTHLPRLFPHADAKSWFDGNAPLIEETAFRNASLQGAYLMMAARALGFDCGPMSGFDKDLMLSARWNNPKILKIEMDLPHKPRNPVPCRADDIDSINH